MRVVVLSSYPLVDAFAHKETVLRGLVERGYETRLFYAGLAPGDYIREARRRRPLLELRSRVRARRAYSSRPSEPRPKARRLRDTAQDLGVPVLPFHSLGEPDCARAIASFAPDVLLNLSALYVPKAFLEASGYRVVGGHYADLPRLRGVDTVRWSILLDHPMIVSHQFLTPEFDMGNVVSRVPVAVRRGDGIPAIRRRCQDAAAAGHLAVAEHIAVGKLKSEPQRAKDGTTFFQMGAYLRDHVDKVLRDGRYSHASGGETV
jgi:hypothetical protein